jgi:manganese efflux pump family protein
VRQQPKESTGSAQRGCISVCSAVSAGARRGRTVKLAIKAAAVAGGVLAALSVIGCGAEANAAAVGAAAGRVGAPQASAQACTAYGVHAIEHHITVTWMPGPCRSLSKTEVNRAVAMAVVRVAGDAPKAVRRKRAAEAARYLEYLVTAPPSGSSSLPAASGSSPARGGRDLAMSVAALFAWLVTAGSGAYVLGSWIIHGGSLRHRAGNTSTGSPPTVIFGHFGLALSGLVIWIAYLITGWAALAWAAVGVLLPVAGLGMATLANGLPGYRAPAVTGQNATAAAGYNATTAAGSDHSGADADGTGTAGALTFDTGIEGTLTVDTGTSGAQAIRIGAGGAQTISRGKDASQPAIIGTRTGTVSVRARLSPLVVAGHGLLAVTTVLLVLLAALGAAAN